MEKNLYEAAIEGNVTSLHEILREDRLILDRVGICNCFNASPLHVAASRGHVEFVRELLSRNQELADVLDSRQRSPLHLASAKGHIEVVKELILANPEMCTARDLDGRNSLHVAAMKGKVEVLEELVRANPLAASVRMDSGETILHLAVAHKQFEIVRYLLRDHRHRVDVNATNTNGNTALDILLQSETNMDLSNIKDTFREVGAKIGKNLEHGEQLAKIRETLLIIASLITTLAFQAGVNPPGGVWKDNIDHRAGEAVMAYNYPNSFPFFLRANTIALVASLTTILLLMSELPFVRKGFLCLLWVITWMTITSIAFTYVFSITVITPYKQRPEKAHFDMVVLVIVWYGVMALLLILKTVRNLYKKHTWF